MTIRKFFFWPVLLFAVVFILILASSGFLNPPKIHFYGDSTKKLSKTSLQVFYFVPNNKKDKIFEDWFPSIEQAIREVSDFHRRQFSGFSVLSFEIYPQPVIGQKDNFFYDGIFEDGQKTNYGNPGALFKVVQEIKNRNLAAEQKPGEYRVLAIVYEGVGASGSQEQSLLVARAYLTQEKLKDFGPSIFEHELMHAFGVPDFYEAEDIMGKGRYKPLRSTYISDDIKNKMGF